MVTFRRRRWKDIISGIDCLTLLQMHIVSTTNITSYGAGKIVVILFLFLRAPCSEKTTDLLCHALFLLFGRCRFLINRINRCIQNALRDLIDSNISVCGFCCTFIFARSCLLGQYINQDIFSTVKLFEHRRGSGLASLSGESWSIYVVEQGGHAIQRRIVRYLSCRRSTLVTLRRRFWSRYRGNLLIIQYH